MTNESMPHFGLLASAEPKKHEMGHSHPLCRNKYIDIIHAVSNG
jgi:hypothetical protein